MRPLPGSVVATATLALAITTMPGATAQAAEPSPLHDPDWTTVATGLSSPRLLSFAGGALYVAESGRGGDGPCVEGAEGRACVGASGAITRVTQWGQKRVITRLPSAAGEDGSAAAGPTDVMFNGKTYTISMGLGNNPAVRRKLGRHGSLFGTVLTVKEKRRHHKTRSKPRILADLAAFERRHDPDGAGPDSNPGGFDRNKRGLVATDAGGNTLLRVKNKHRGDRRGAVKLLATFPDRMVPAPPFMPPGDMPMQAVPTSVVRGGGAYYVSQLTGFPFPAGASTVWRVAPGKAPKAYATGLTNVTDLAWHRGALYVVQLSDDGLLTVEEDALPAGSLRKVTSKDTTRVVAEDLPAPYGVALKGRNAYVTTCAVCAGGGSVVKIGLGRQR